MIWFPSSAEEGQTLAREGGPTPAGVVRPGVAETSNRALRVMNGMFDTKRANEDFRVTFQTTPVPLRDTSPPDLRRGARKTSNLQAALQAACVCGFNTQGFVRDGAPSRSTLG